MAKNSEHGHRVGAMDKRSQTFNPIDPERKRIDRAEILTDEELADPAVVDALHKLKAKAEKDLYAGRTKRLDYITARQPL